VAHFARGDRPPYSSARTLIEEYYRALPEGERNDVAQRLRSLDDDVFVAQLYEVYVSRFCAGMGEVFLHQALPDGKKPDIIWAVGGTRVVMDVVTMLGDKSSKVERRTIDDLLNYLGQIEHHFYVWVDYDEVDESCLQPSQVRSRLVAFLDRLDPAMTDEAEETVVLPGFKATFAAIPRQNPEERQPIAFGVEEPARWIQPAKSVRGSVRKKTKKYGSATAPLLVAVCRGPSADGVDWDDVATVLYGPVLYTPNVAAGSLHARLGPGGLVMPHGRPGPLNRSLTGVLHCAPLRKGDEFGLQVRYLMNPYAERKLELPLPTYPTEDEGKYRFRWSTAPEIDPGIH
jgi:hypothetical protein